MLQNCITPLCVIIAIYAISGWKNNLHLFLVGFSVETIGAGDGAGSKIRNGRDVVGVKEVYPANFWATRNSVSQILEKSLLLDFFYFFLFRVDIYFVKCSHLFLVGFSVETIGAGDGVGSKIRNGRDAVGVKEVSSANFWASREQKCWEMFIFSNLKLHFSAWIISGK